MKNTPNMVKGVRLIIHMAMFFTAFVTLPLTSSLEVEIKKLTYNNNGLGRYTFEYETSDGSYRREEGGLIGDPNAASLVVRGEYGYIDSQGKPYSIKYIADANGYQPSIQDDYTRYNDRRII